MDFIIRDYQPAHVYTLTMPRGERLIVVTGLSALSLLALGMLVIVFANGGWSVHLPLILFVCAGLAWSWYIFIDVPYEIRFESAERLSFVALRGIRSLAAAQLHSLQPCRGGGVYVLRYEGGKIHLLVQITGFHEVIMRIKAVNPAFQVIGI